jgi:hypothetical protein
MNGILAWIGLVGLAGGLVAAVVALVRRPMHTLLTANAHLAPAAGFYGRGFVIVLVLAALAAVVGTSAPCPQQAAEKACMEWVWWTVDGLKPVCWSVLGILMGYVLLLTILYAVLGRYREQ